MEYIIYQEISDSSFDATLIKGKNRYEWFCPTSGIIKETGTIKVPDGKTAFRAPFKGDATPASSDIHADHRLTIE